MTSCSASDRLASKPGKQLTSLCFLNILITQGTQWEPKVRLHCKQCPSYKCHYTCAAWMACALIPSGQEDAAQGPSLQSFTVYETKC